MRGDTEGASPLKTREEYDRAWAIVRKHITAWDPYALIAGGAPPTEFDAEIAAVVKEIPRIHSAEDLAGAISGVLCDSFGFDTFPPKDCQELAESLFTDLYSGRLISNRANKSR